MCNTVFLATEVFPLWMGVTKVCDWECDDVTRVFDLIEPPAQLVRSQSALLMGAIDSAPFWMPAAKISYDAVESLG